MKIIWIGVTILVLTALFFGFKFSRFGLESPEYTVVDKDGDFEIRAYPEVYVVSTAMEHPDPEQGDSFMRLFGYISGNNEENQKISMTTPVLTTGSGDDKTMSFVVPKAVVASGVPEASSASVRIETIAGGKFAAYRFSGNWDLSAYREAREKLLSWAKAQGYAVAGEAMIANYDPPMTPGFLKRNEVVVRIEESDAPQ